MHLNFADILNIRGSKFLDSGKFQSSIQIGVEELIYRLILRQTIRQIACAGWPWEKTKQGWSSTRCPKRAQIRVFIRNYNVLHCYPPRSRDLFVGEHLRAVDIEEGVPRAS